MFGVDAVTVATFEHRVKFTDGSQGYIDCFWLGARRCRGGEVRQQAYNSKVQDTARSASRPYRSTEISQNFHLPSNKKKC